MGDTRPKGKAAGGDRYDVLLTGGGGRRIAVTRVFNEISGMKRVGAELPEIFSRPTLIKQGVTKNEAAQIKPLIEDAGGSAESLGVTRLKGQVLRRRSSSLL